MAQKKHRFTKIFVVCGLIVLTAALVLFIAGMSAANWNFSKLSTVQYSVLTFEQTDESIRSIDVRYQNADIAVTISPDAEKIAVKYPVRTDADGKQTAVTLKTEDGTLYLTESDDNFQPVSWFFGSIPRVEIVLPAAEYSSLHLQTDTGDIRVTDVTAAQDIVLQTDTGDIELSGISAAAGIAATADTGDIRLSNVTATQKITLKSDVGDLTLNSVSAAEIEAGADTGNISVSGVGAGTITLATDTGDIRGTLAGKQNDYTISVQTGTGSSNLQSGGSGAKRLTASTDVGDIELYFAE